MDLQKMLLIYELMGGNGNTDPQPPDQEFTITVESNVDAIFTSNGLTFVNGVAKTMIAGTYQITAQAEGYNSEKKSITVNNLNPNGFWYFDLTEQSTDPGDAYKAEYSFEVLVNGETSTKAYNVYYEIYTPEDSSSGEIRNNVGEIVLKYVDENFDSENVLSELDFFVILNDRYDLQETLSNAPTLVRIDNGVAYYSFGTVNLVIEDEQVSYSITATSNIPNTNFSGYNFSYDYDFSFTNGVAQIAEEGEYVVYASAPGYISKKNYIELTESEPQKEVHFELESVNPEVGDPSSTNRAEYSFEVTVNGETAKGNKEIRGYFENSFEDVYKNIEFISSGKIVVKYVDDKFNGISTDRFDLYLSVYGIPDGYFDGEFILENPTLVKVENGTSYFEFDTINVEIEDEAVTPDYSIYITSTPSNATFTSPGLTFDYGMAEVSGIGEYVINVSKQGYFEKDITVSVTEDNPNPFYNVVLDKAPAKYTITATSNVRANFMSWPSLSFSSGVAEAFEEGTYEITCYANGYIEQIKEVIVSDSNPNPSVSFELEIDTNNPPDFDEIYYSVEVTIDGVSATGSHTVDYTIYNDDEGKHYSDYLFTSGKIVLVYEDRYVYGNGVLDSMMVDLNIDGEDKGTFEITNPTLKSVDGYRGYYEFDSINIGEEVDPDPTYTITVESNVTNTTFSSPGLNFVNGIASFSNPGTYVVTASADEYVTQSHTFNIDDNNANGYYSFELEEDNYTIELSSNASNAVFKKDNGDIIENIAEYDDSGIKVIYCSAPDYIDQVAILNINNKNRHREYYFEMDEYSGIDADYSITASSDAWGYNEFRSTNPLYPLEFVGGYYNNTQVAEAESNVSYSIKSLANGYDDLVINNIILNDNKPHIRIYFEMSESDNIEEWFIEDIDYEGSDAINVYHRINTGQVSMEWRGGIFEVYENDEIIYRESNIKGYNGFVFTRSLNVSPEDFALYKNPKYSLKFYREIGPEIPVKFEIRENAVDNNELNTSGNSYSWETKEFMRYGIYECNNKEYLRIITRADDGRQANYYNSPNECYPNEEEYPNKSTYIENVSVQDYDTVDDLDKNQIRVRWEDNWMNNSHTIKVKTSGLYESEYSISSSEYFYTFTSDDLSNEEELIVEIKIRGNYLNGDWTTIKISSNGQSPDGNYLILESIEKEGVIPAPALTRACEWDKGILGVNSGIRVYYNIAENYNVSNIRVLCSSTATGSTMIPLEGFDVSANTTDLGNGEYRTNIKTSHVLVGLDDEIEIGFQIVTEDGKYSTISSVASNFGLTTGVQGFCRNLS